MQQRAAALDVTICEQGDNRWNTDSHLGHSTKVIHLGTQGLDRDSADDEKTGPAGGGIVCRQKASQYGERIRVLAVCDEKLIGGVCLHARMLTAQRLFPPGPVMTAPKIG